MHPLAKNEVGEKRALRVRDGAREVFCSKKNFLVSLENNSLFLITEDKSGSLTTAFIIFSHSFLVAD